MGGQGSDGRGLLTITEDISGHFSRAKIKLTGNIHKKILKVLRILCPIILNLRVFPNKSDSKDEKKIRCINITVLKIEAPVLFKMIKR